MEKPTRSTYQLLVDHIVSGQADFYRLAFSYVKNRDAALDVVQEAVVKALSKADSLREPAYLKTWFYRILLNESMNYFRRSRGLLSFDEALDEAFRAEHGCQHSAMIHSSNVHNMSRAARRMNTTIFVKNAPSYSGLGFGGEGYTTLTIATPTGEGLTSAKSFTRARRCVLKGDFRII